MPAERLRSLLAALIPGPCGLCGAAAAAAAGICSGCEGRLRPVPVRRILGGGVSLVATGPHEGAHRELVHALKYRRALALAAPAASLLAATADRLIDPATPPLVPTPAAIVPVPAAPRRRRRRGFDPAEELALALARRTGAPYAPCLRRRDGPRQVGRVRERRLADPPAVHCAGRAPLRCLIVDDVVTTGATISACATALRTGGAREVAAVVIAAA